MPIATVLPQLLSTKSQAALKEFMSQCYMQYTRNWAIRDQMRYIDLQYQRELDYSTEQLRAKASNRIGDKSRFQNITVPIVLPQVEAQVTYQSSVFLTGTPLFGVDSTPEFEDEAKMLETVIDDQAIRGGWVRHFNMFFRDGAKYNLSALEIDWSREVSWTPETDTTGAVGTRSKTKQTEVIWEGNAVRRWDLYNTFFDTRVMPAEMHQYGEFCGNTKLMSRIALKQFIATIPEIRIDNLKAAFESPQASISIADSTLSAMSYYIPQINPRTFVNPTVLGDTDWMAWAGLAGNTGNIKYHNNYTVTTLYARILPSDFGISGPAQNTPQVWKLIFVNFSILIYAERQTNAHNLIPVLMGVPNEDGLGLQTKSTAENVSPIQDITSALSNSDIAARRRAISDRTLFDPSRVTMESINSPNPSAKIPVRPAAYGKPLGEAVYPFPFRDDQSQFIQAKIQSYTAMANMISGSNPVRQGQFVKGNKTRDEFNDVMSNANGRDQVTAMGYEAQIFTPLKEILKINTLQYQGGITLFNRDQKQAVVVDPVKLRQAVMQFKVSDGLTPAEKLMDSDTNMVAMQMIGTSPAIEAAYNIAPMFSYLMKQKGAHISEFEKSPEQQAYESALQQYNQMVTQLYAQNKDQDPNKLPPRPLPADYGYDPAGAKGNDASNTATGNEPNLPQSSNAQTNPVTAALKASGVQ